MSRFVQTDVIQLDIPVCSGLECAYVYTCKLLVEMIKQVIIHIDDND